MTEDQPRAMRMLVIREHPDPPTGLNTTGEDINQLTVSGHIEHDLELYEDDYGQWVCRFVLTHTTTHYETGHWELQYYDVTLYGARPFAHRYRPRQTILVSGQLDHPAGRTQPRPAIKAHRITIAHGPHPER
jgi:hypothetical protein